MTSIPSAQTKPPPLSFLPPLPPSQKPPLPSPANARTSNSRSFTANHRVSAFEIDDRPVKRRKIEEETGPQSTHPLHTPQHNECLASRYVSASWKDTYDLDGGRGEQSELSRPRIPPLPEPPWQGMPSVKKRTTKPRSSCRVREEIAVPNTPDAVKPLKEVPGVEQEQPVDYFVWKGIHPEDQLTHTNVKQGYFDRAPDNPEKELNTGKAQIYNAVTRHHGLDSLSALFSLLLDERIKHNTIAGKQSVTLPPRVTLTEAKRRQWIADLANEGVPMSKLKKAIPQGIRGQALLDLCLANKVPRKRALWFIKCVGAIELRAIKKKGGAANVVAAAETRWLRDWTVGTERWIEQVVARCGQADWTVDMQYVSQSVVSLYHDNLLDRDHYLDWLAEGLVCAKLEHTQAWLILVNACRVDLLKYRKRIRDVTKHLLQVFSQARSQHAEPLLASVKSLLRRNALDQPTSLLAPDQWQVHESAVRSLFDLNATSELRVLNIVTVSNARFMKALHNENSTVSRERRTLHVLDSVCTPIDLSALSAKLLETEPDLHRLCVICMKWATSRFRAGAKRIYLAVRLLRRWCRVLDTRVEQTVLDFFCHYSKDHLYDGAMLQHLTIEVVRSALLSVSRFMHWLSVQAIPTAAENRSSPQQSGTKHVQMCYHLLLHLPLANLEPHDVNLRRYLLRRINHQVEHDGDTIGLLKTITTDILEDSSHDGRVDCELLGQLRQLSWSCRSSVSTFLRSKALEYARTFLNEVPGKPPLPGAQVFSLRQFCVFRAFVESLEDEPVLADVLRIFATTEQESLLAALADTVSYHAESFAAIGALEALQDIYIKRYIALRVIRPNLPLFATALLDLCEQHPTRVTRAGAVRSDLLRGARERGVGPCSPFSDTIAEALQRKDGERFVEEFESVLQAEVNMHEQTMSSLFAELVGRLCKAEDVPTLQICQLLGRLRLFKQDQFDISMRQWLRAALTSHWSSIGLDIVLELLNARATSVADLMAVMDTLPVTLEVRVVIEESLARMAMDTSSSGVAPDKAYIVKMGMCSLSTKQPGRMFEFWTARVGDEPDILAAHLRLLAPQLLQGENRLVFTSSRGKDYFINAVDCLLETNEKDGDQFICRVVDKLNPLSLPACRYRLGEFNMGVDSVASRDAYQERAATCIFDSMKLSIEHDTEEVEMVREVLMALPETSAYRVRQLCEQQFYHVFMGRCHVKGSNPVALWMDDGDEEVLARAVQKVTALDHLGLRPGASGQLGLFIDMLMLVSKWVSGKCEAGLTCSTSPGTAAVSPGVSASLNTSESVPQENVVKAMHYLNYVLGALSSKLTIFAPSPERDAASARGLQGEQMKLMALLISIATHPKVTRLSKSSVSAARRKMLHDTITFALHSAALVADHLGDEGRSVLARMLRDKLADKRVQWLIGSVGLCGSALALDHTGLMVVSESRGNLGEFKPQPWEMLESHGGDPCLSMSLFGAVKVPT